MLLTPHKGGSVLVPIETSYSIPREAFLRVHPAVLIKRLERHQTDLFTVLYGENTGRIIVLNLFLYKPAKEGSAKVQSA
jgi:hypothetical protein